MNATTAQALDRIARIRRSAETRWLVTRTPAAWNHLVRAVDDERALRRWAQLAG